MQRLLADAAALLFPALVGLPVALLIQIADSWIELLGIAFLMGSAITTVGLTFLGVIGVPYTTPVLLALLALWTVALAWTGRSRILQVGANVRFPRMHWVGWLLLGLTVANVATGAAYAYHTPIVVHDVVVHWWPKAEAIRAARSLGAVGHAVFPDYPPAWPLHLFLVRAISGSTSVVKVLPSLYFLSMLAVVFGYLRMRVGGVTAAATAWVISSIPYVWFPYGLNDLMSEIPFMALAVGSAVLLVSFLEKPRGADLLAMLLLTAGIVLLRPEGLEHALIIVAVLAVASWLRSRDWRPAALGFGTVLVVYLGWQGYARLVLKTPATFRPILGRLIGALSPDSVGALLRYAGHEFVNPFVFGPTAIAILCLLVGWRGRRRYALLVATFLLDVAAMSLIYLILPTTDISTSLSWWLITGFKRVLLHFAPLIFIAAALAIEEPLRAAWRARRQGRKESMTPRAATTRGRWSASTIAMPLLTAIAIGAVGWATYQLTGPRDIALAQVIPNGFANLEPIEYLPNTGGANTMVFTATSPGSVALLFELHNLGVAGPPPNDTIFGRFTGFRGLVGLPQGANVTERFVVTADGRVIGQSREVGPDPATVTLTGPIPPQAQILGLGVDPTGSAIVTASWLGAVLHRDSAWLPVEILLAIGAIVSLALAAVTIGGSRAAATALQNIGPGFLGVVLLAAGLVQQLDVLTNSASPLWYAAARRALHVLHGI